MVRPIIKNPAVESNYMIKKLHTSPPNDWEAYPFYGVPDPPLPRTMARIGVDDIVNRMVFEVDFNKGLIGAIISERDAASLTYDQRWIIHCNMLWAIHGFLKQQMTQEIVNNIKASLENTLRWLASIENSPGDFGQNDIG